MKGTVFQKNDAMQLGGGKATSRQQRKPTEKKISGRFADIHSHAGSCDMNDIDKSVHSSNKQPAWSLKRVMESQYRTLKKDWAINMDGVPLSHKNAHWKA